MMNFSMNSDSGDETPKRPKRKSVAFDPKNNKLYLFTEREPEPEPETESEPEPEREGP